MRGPTSSWEHTPVSAALLRQLASSVRESFLDVWQAAPCCRPATPRTAEAVLGELLTPTRAAAAAATGGVPVAQVVPKPVPKRPRPSIGEVNVSDIASPQRVGLRDSCHFLEPCGDGSPGPAAAPAAAGAGAGGQPPPQQQRTPQRTPSGQTRSPRPHAEAEGAVDGRTSRGGRRSGGGGAASAAACGGDAAAGPVTPPATRRASPRGAGPKQPGGAGPAPPQESKLAANMAARGSNCGVRKKGTAGHAIKVARGCADAHSDHGDHSRPQPVYIDSRNDHEEHGVILDLSEILEVGAMLDWSQEPSPERSHNSSSMMGTSIDESIYSGTIAIPDHPEPRLGGFVVGPATRRAPLTSAPAAPSKGPRAPKPPPTQPLRTVCFPAPPVHASEPLFHSGHYQKWRRSPAPRHGGA